MNGHLNVNIHLTLITNSLPKKLFGTKMWGIYITHFSFYSTEPLIIGFSAIKTRGSNL